MFYYNMDVKGNEALHAVPSFERVKHFLFGGLFGFYQSKEGTIIDDMGRDE